MGDAPEAATPPAAPRRLLDRLSTAEKIISVIGAAALALTTFIANTTQNQLTKQNGVIDAMVKRQELELQQRKDSREADRQQNELTREIFGEFVKAITEKHGSPEDRLDRLEGVMVLTWAIPDPHQQEGMARAVQKSIDRLKPQAGAGALATRINAASFDAEELLVRAAAEQKTAPPPTTSASSEKSAARWSNYDFDIFWCEGMANSAQYQARAEAISAFKTADPQASGRWRARPLPSGVNARPGYQVSGVEIRTSSSDEAPLAEALKKQIEARFPATRVDLRQTTQNTPWYLSVFVCAG